MSAYREVHPECKGKLTFHQPGETQCGLCWGMQLSCDSCEYVSPRRNLYTEVETSRRGPKAASPNIAAQVSLSHTGMSNTGLSRLLLGKNTPAPSRSSVQATTNSQQVHQETNEKDMAELCENLKIVQDERGQIGINIETDARRGTQRCGREYNKIKKKYAGCQTLVNYVHNGTKTLELVIKITSV